MIRSIDEPTLRGDTRPCSWIVRRLSQTPRMRGRAASQRSATSLMQASTEHNPVPVLTASGP